MRFSKAVSLLSLPFLGMAAPLEVSKKSPSWYSTGYEVGIYYVNWAIYGRQHFVTDLPEEKLTKITYAFANISADTGEVSLSDIYADTQFMYPTDVKINATNGTTYLYGNFNQLYKLKQKNRNLKVVLSVGGWSFRGYFKTALATPENRKRFADSSLKLIADLGLDGLDIDWEYPADSTDAYNLVETVKLCRQTYDEYAAKYANGYHFDFDISAPAGPPKYTVMPIAAMDQYITQWKLMAFDYMGPGFSNYTGHLSNVYPSLTNPRSTDFNTAQAIDYYKANVASPDKIILGMPLYGRSFAHASSHIGGHFNGSGTGTWEAGVIDYKDLPLQSVNTTKVHHDLKVVGAWSYDSKTKQLVSYDTPDIQCIKTDYLQAQGLGGGWWWDSSSDRKDDKSLVTTVYNRLGGAAALRQSRNNLYYPNSKYANIKAASVALV